MSDTQNSCQYVPSDTKKEGLSLIYGTSVSCTFGDKLQSIAVDNVDFAIEENKITSIVGSSGSGKTTLLKLIYGLLEPDDGEIRYRGWLVPTRKDKLIPGHEAMKMVSQGFDDLNTYAKVWDNIASQLSNIDLEYKENKTKEVLQQLQIEHLQGKRVADLSGGERQRVAIARALVNNPEVLLMDEPFNQVDAAFRDALQQDIQNIVNDSNLTVVLVSHDPAEVLALSDQLIVMKEGRVIESGAPKKLYQQPQHIYTAQLLAKSNILTRHEAKRLGIDAPDSIAIHQEQVNIQKNGNASFEIKNIKFRGPYNELIVGDDDVSIHAIDYLYHSFKVGDRVKIEIKKYISFG